MSTVNEVEPFANNLKLAPRILQRFGLASDGAVAEEDMDFYVSRIVRAMLADEPGGVSEGPASHRA